MVGIINPAISKKDSSRYMACQYLRERRNESVQVMHLGPYDDEPATVVIMERFAMQSGYAIDINGERRHHEIYLSDPGKTASEKMKTILRHPVRKV